MPGRAAGTFWMFFKHKGKFGGKGGVFSLLFPFFLLFKWGSFSLLQNLISCHSTPQIVILGNKNYISLAGHKL